ncbi:hypothetical protein TNCV_2375751 [Trichonephila clavipes]|nr:hypothetical protein TNCV_2375751 [Trichonephila clavipes]
MEFKEIKILKNKLYLHRVSRGYWRKLYREIGRHQKNSDLQSNPWSETSLFGPRWRCLHDHWRKQTTLTQSFELSSPRNESRLIAVIAEEYGMVYEQRAGRYAPDFRIVRRKCSNKDDT